MQTQQTDFLIIGAGIVGLAIAKYLREKYPAKTIAVLEKESTLAYHASGRNSGVLHAGFYYSAGSLKSKFTLEGNRAWKNFCREKQLPLNENGKVVVAKNDQELQGLHTLYERGRENGIPLQLVSTQELAEIEPNAKTHELALYSPETATVSPQAIVQALAKELEDQQIEIFLGEAFQSVKDGLVQSSKRLWQAGKVINAAGLYADKIAKQYGFGQDFIIMPFKGLYLKYEGQTPPLKVNVYPVPDLAFPFLGVHFTVTVDGQVKIGPTAIPAFWRENYQGLSRFNGQECFEILKKQGQLFWQNAFGFRRHALEELKKNYRPYFVSQAAQLVNQLDTKGFKHWSAPGIRAQLFNIKTQQLVQDFVVEGDTHSVHVLNAVSPAFTCALPFAQWVVEQNL
ncbi:MAG: dependent oxidoreductase [Gammaproteobacteria bacterium]|nr:dependent oxidoreductase [Gammaproteobacteria bacterium]